MSPYVLVGADAVADDMEVLRLRHGPNCHAAVALLHQPVCCVYTHVWWNPAVGLSVGVEEEVL